MSGSIGEITVFTNGDSGQISTWSNVPYFFTETLKTKGIKVNRVDLNPDPLLGKLWDKTMGRIVRHIFKGHTKYDYFRSGLHFTDVRRRIKRALKQFPDADANVFLTFSFSSAGLSNKPTLLLGDWTYGHVFKYYVNHEPAFLEKRCLKRENAQIERADLVLALFPGVAGHMKRTHANKNIHYLGNVINSLYEVGEQEALQLKRDSFDVLFVGSAKYMEGAKALIQAYKNLRKDFVQLKLHIIGMKKAELGEELPEGVCCHGYLDKAKDEDRVLYYDLFKKAKIFVNTTPKWAAFSATIEAMYFYIPVTVTPYDEFVETFGREIRFGKFCGNSSAEIEENIRLILNDHAYDEMCIHAHHAVKEFTWSAYVDKVLRKLESKASLFKSEHAMQQRSPSRAWFHSVNSLHEPGAKTVEPSATVAAPIPINEK